MNSIHNTALRLCLGAFRSSPVESLYCEANEPPLWIRRQHLLLNYIISVSSNPLNPVYSLFTNDSLQNISTSSTIRPLPSLLKTMPIKIDISQTFPLPLPLMPPWTKNIPHINTSLTTLNKNETPNDLIKKTFLDIIYRNEYDLVLYTDASKNETGVGCAVTTLDSPVFSSTISSTCTVHTSELYSILQVFKHISAPNKNVCICTDSLASIHSIKDIYSDHPLIQNIHDSYQLSFSQNITVTILWTPSHIGIMGNELADQLAKRATTLNYYADNIQIASDLKQVMKHKIKSLWQNHWNSIPTKLQKIQPSLSHPYYIGASNLSRQDLAVLRRLRIGHTRFTHGYLMSSNSRPFCSTCNCIYTVEHIILECQQYTTRRQQLNLKGSLQEILGNPDNVPSVLQFLKDVQLYHKI